MGRHEQPKRGMAKWTPKDWASVLASAGYLAEKAWKIWKDWGWF